MKKVLFLMIAALSAGFAGAVTTVWSATAPASSTSGQSIIPSGTAPVASASIVACITTPSSYASNSANVLTIGLWDQGNIAFRIGSGTFTMNTTGAATFTAGTSVTLAADQTYVLTALFENTGSGMTGKFYVNDTLLASGNYNSTNGINISSYYTYPTNFYELKDIAGYSGVLTDDERAALVSSGTSILSKAVPEPTMLALIALGVAGLALKRRA